MIKLILTVKGQDIVEAFVAQNGTQVFVRSVTGFHDRSVIVDNGSCYQTGASLKDGAKNSPSTHTQITDVFLAVSQTYEDLQASATVEI